LNGAGITPSRPRGNRKTVVSWAARVEGAGSAQEVVEVGREFLAQLTPYEVHGLPASCAPPPKLVDADDVTAYALALVRHDCAGDCGDADLAHKLADFFSHASGRLARLANDAGVFPDA
jgi:hypothetical protein